MQKKEDRELKLIRELEKLLGIPPLGEISVADKVGA